MTIENSKTLQCLVNAFTGESLARNRYTIFAKIAKKEGFELISEIFLETAANEEEHAKLFYKQIPNGMYIPDTTYPFFAGNTYENLISAANGEKDEWEVIYKNSAQTAKNEGFTDISRLFTNIAEIEKRHAHRYSVLANQIKNETLYKKEEISQWVCTKCGHTHIGKEAPCSCPVCNHVQSYFRLFTDNF